MLRAVPTNASTDASTGATDVAPGDTRAARTAVAARADARDRAAGVGAPTRLRTALGAATGVVLLAATAAVASGGVTAALPAGPDADVAVPAAAVPAGDYTAVCPAPPRPVAPSGDGDDPEFGPASRTAKTTVSGLVLSDLGATVTGSALLPVGGEEPLDLIREFAPESSLGSRGPAGSSEDGLTTRVAGVTRGTAVDAPSVLRAQAQGGLTPVAAASATYTATDGDLRGLAATACQVPSSDFWLLGAATTAGQSSVLTLTNPTGTPAAVSLELHGPDGPIEAAGTRGELVAPGETRRIVLGAFAGDQEHVAVRVRSAGGRVTGVIQQSVLRGLTPGGVDLLSPSAPAGLTQVVPGVVVQDTATARRIREQDGYATASPELQVLVPGASDAVLDLRVFGPDGEVELPDGGVVTAPAGAVTGVPLDALPAGNYTIAVTSDVSVVAAARVTRGTDDGKPVDLAGAPAAVRLGSGHAMALAEGVDAALVLGAPGGRGEITLTPVSADGVLGKPVVIGIAGGTSVTVPASSLGRSPVAVLVDATGDPVYGAQVMTLPGTTSGISVVAVPVGVTAPQDLPVDLGY
ncbi:hypothetical protein C4K88_08030 [Arthrobacter pityocampae]|uniref:Large extracellular alpha-helical protein n=1 Tax=Arthrobacter pityocampae TaxID=547334 RepID=A0A2S5IYF0_9MICC|nr:DUF5719 family protein [Arthrobacter pityocampae]PPB49622.1 hypothetical protein C4K88_08030 [Arthrobacter pityocampae]